MADSLLAVLRIRRLAVNDANRELAALLRLEEAAQSKADAAEARIALEGESAAELAQADEAVEAYAAWLPVGRANAVVARAEHEQLSVEVAKARAALTIARAAAEAASDLMKRRNAEHVKSADQAMQVALDEFATQRPFRD